MGDFKVVLQSILKPCMDYSGRATVGAMHKKRRLGRPSTGGTNPQVKFSIDAEHVTRLAEIADSRGCSISTVVREAVLAYLREVKVVA